MVATEMSKQNGNEQADLVELAETFCEQLMETAKAQKIYNEAQKQTAQSLMN